MLLRDLSMLRIDLESHHFPILRNCSRQPDRAVSAECSDLEYSSRTDGFREYEKKFSERRRDFKRWQACSFTLSNRSVEHRIGRKQHFPDVFVDGCPYILSHSSS